LLDTHSISTGQYYWEVSLDRLQNPNCLAFGASRTTGDLSSYVGSNKDGWSLIVMNREGMKKWNSPLCENYGSAGTIFREGDRVGVLLDYTHAEGTLSFFLNGRCMGMAFSGLPPNTFPVISLHSKGDQITLLSANMPGDRCK